MAQSDEVIQGLGKRIQKCKSKQNRNH